MASYYLSPCLECRRISVDSVCSARQKVCCGHFLSYVQKLKQIKNYHILLQELKQLVTH